MTTSDLLKLDPNDNVAVALKKLSDAGVPAGHKQALRAISKGEAVVKYGQIIGVALSDIAEGEHVHSHNLGMDDFARDYAPCSRVKLREPTTDIPTFMGYRRPSGAVGTRNFVGIVSTVNCSATAVQNIAKGLNKLVEANYPTIDGVVPITHHQGCAAAIGGEGDQNLQRVLGGYCRHPNFAFVIVVGLGCEGMQVSRLFEAEGLSADEYIRSLVIQASGGLRATIASGIEEGRALLDEAAQIKREPISVSELSLALQCGGSDGYSGITANPALGKAADILVGYGGTAILAETPEIYGAEHLLTQRAVSPEVADKLVERIKWWESYCARNGGSMDNNPSPGNKAGGLTTILEKSLGAVAKGGTTNLEGVYHYAEPIDRKGFVFMDSPGYDPASITGEVASGANLIAFTTGRGSVYGCKPVPSIKLATNSLMYYRMSEDMDVNCGDILEGSATIESKGQEVFDLLVRVASGEQSKSEEMDLGDHEFVPWHIGAVM